MPKKIMADIGLFMINNQIVRRGRKRRGVISGNWQKCCVLHMRSATLVRNATLMPEGLEILYF
ncbi:hypothetical protein SAMN05660330_03794 [Desulforhopalus singaporensis]|uniref:Uncharacterized protein n=1 Tax=Desulforhopalus singaporensis TaxID=91360 RepID=A0A1H0V040_9BACT|nr:hypothetical protein SAMN05660330_03794 [Desulforhopalus singaporensis]